MNILLINPYYIEPVLGDGSITTIVPNFPIGLAYIAAYMREKTSHNIMVLDASCSLNSYPISEGNKIIYGLAEDDLISKIKKSRPDLVGISGMYTKHAEGTHLLAKLVKSCFPEVPVVAGGSHVSLLPEVVINDDNIDYVCIGEGEITFLELSNRLCNKKSIDDILGICFKNNGKVIINSPRPRITDLDSLPFPARDMFDFNFYTRNIGNADFLMRQPWGYLITSRGCPFNCKFCNVRHVWTKKWISRSSGSIVSEMSLMIKEYGIREFAFMDDCASVNRNSFKELLEKIISEKLNIRFTFPTGLAFTTLDKEIIDLLYKAGCYRLTFGIESGNKDIRKHISKTWSLDKAKELIQYANKIGMWTINTNIIGFLNETKEQMEDTFNFNVQSDVDMAIFYLLHTHPAADIYKEFEDAGIVPSSNLVVNGQEKYLDFYKKIYPYVTDTPQRNLNYSANELLKFQSEFYNNFLKKRFINNLLNPFHIIRKIRSLESFKYVLKIAFVYSKMFTYMVFQRNKLDLSRRIFLLGRKNKGNNE